MANPHPSQSSKPKYTIHTHPPILVLTLSSTIPFSALPSLSSAIPKLYAYLAHQNLPMKPAGPPFFRFMAIPVGMGADQMLKMEVGVVVDEGEDGRFDRDGEGKGENTSKGEGEGIDTSKLELKHLPAGQYLETIHIGEPSSLKGATKALLEYAEREGLEFDIEQGGEGKLSQRDRVDGEGGLDAKEEKVDRWVGRFEWYESDPGVVSQREWRTRLSFKLR